MPDVVCSGTERQTSAMLSPQRVQKDGYEYCHTSTVKCIVYTVWLVWSLHDHTSHIYGTVAEDEIPT